MNEEITETEVLTWEIDKLWNYFLQIEEMQEINKELKEKVKYGLNIKVPIWYLTEEWYKIYPNNKEVKIDGHGKFEINDFMNEKDNREKIIRNIIIESLQTDEITSPRIQ